MWKRAIHNIIGTMFLMLFLFGCSTKSISLDDKLIEDKEVDLANKEVTLVEEIENEEIDPIIEVEEISVEAIGDILIHKRVYNDAKVAEGYDFMPMLEQVTPYIGNATITFANQETMIGGVEHGLSTYPAFNSPTEVGDALKKIGVNIVSLANNHTLDRGEEVIQSALNHWEAIDMMYVGAYQDELDRDEVRIIETAEGISVAFLAYTYGTNGIPVPSGKEYLVNLIDKEIIKEDLATAKAKADVTIISLHFGNEYERMPSEEQKELVQFVVDEGVDVVLGHHPHVLQPVEWVTGKEGNKALVAYSLGNFLSGQDKLYRQIGGILKFTITKTTQSNDVTIEIHSPTFLPTFNASDNELNYRVLPLYELTDDVLPNAEQHYQEIKEHMTQWMAELEFTLP